jgi:hypothetical protein
MSLAHIIHMFKEDGNVQHRYLFHGLPFYKFGIFVVTPYNNPFQRPS